MSDQTTDATRVTPNSRTGVVANPGNGAPRLGERVCKCAACGEYFSSTGAFDQHRMWHWDDAPYVTNRRRVCIDPVDRCGLVQRDNGVWGAPPMTEQQKRDRGWA